MKHFHHSCNNKNQRGHLFFFSLKEPSTLCASVQRRYAMHMNQKWGFDIILLYRAIFFILLFLHSKVLRFHVICHLQIITWFFMYTQISFHFISFLKKGYSHPESAFYFVLFCFWLLTRSSWIPTLPNYYCCSNGSRQLLFGFPFKRKERKKS